jgi:serine/threonine protein kinase
MGEVYKAKDTRLDRSVAIKVLPVGTAADPDRPRRCEQEAHAAPANASYRQAWSIERPPPFPAAASDCPSRGLSSQLAPQCVMP